MPDHSGMVHAQHVRCTADSSISGNLIGGPDFVPIIQRVTLYTIIYPKH